MNIKEKEQIELLSKVIGRRINHENDSYIATRIWDVVPIFLPIDNFFQLSRTVFPNIM